MAEIRDEFSHYNRFIGTTLLHSHLIRTVLLPVEAMERCQEPYFIHEYYHYILSKDMNCFLKLLDHFMYIM